MMVNSIFELNDEIIVPSLGIDPSPEAVVDELRERIIDFWKQKKSLLEREDSLKKLAGRVVHLHPDSAANGKCGNKHANLVKMGRVVMLSIWLILKSLCLKAYPQKRSKNFGKNEIQ